MGTFYDVSDILSEAQRTDFYRQINKILKAKKYCRPRALIADLEPCLTDDLIVNLEPCLNDDLMVENTSPPCSNMCARETFYRPSQWFGLL